MPIKKNIPKKKAAVKKTVKKPVVLEETTVRKSLSIDEVLPIEKKPVKQPAIKSLWDKYKIWIVCAIAVLLLILFYIFRPVRIKENEQLKQQRDRAYIVIDSLIRDTKTRQIQDSINADRLLDSIAGIKKKVQYIIVQRNENFDRFIRDATTEQKQFWLDSIFPP
jgi:hypothetical protein